MSRNLTKERQPYALELLQVKPRDLKWSRGIGYDLSWNQGLRFQERLFSR